MDSIIYLYLSIYLQCFWSLFVLVCQTSQILTHLVVWWPLLHLCFNGYRLLDWKLFFFQRLQNFRFEVILFQCTAYIISPFWLPLLLFYWEICCETDCNSWLWTLFSPADQKFLFAFVHVCTHTSVSNSFYFS